MTRLRLLLVALMLVALGGVATQAAAVQAPAPAQADTAGNASGVAPQGITVTDLTALSGATPGEEVTLTATVSNPTDQLRTERVEFRFGGDVVDRTAVALDPGEATTVNVSLNTTGVDPGEYIYAAFTESSGEVGTLMLSDSFTLDSLDAPANATVGENVTVNATVSNPNKFTTTQAVEFRVGGAPTASENVTLEPDSSATVSFEFSAEGLEPGEYLHGAFTRDRGVFARLTLMAPAETPASATFEDQDSDGTTVTVANATLPDDGYVAIHDSSLLDGNVVGSVIGISEYQEAGTYENLTVTLYDVPGAEFNETELTENGTLVAMPHEETGTNTTYDFVATDGAEDGPFVADGQPVTDSAAVTVEAAPNATESNATEANATTQASVVFENQTSDRTTVTVANATLPDDGYVAIHDSSLLDGNVVGSVIGVSEYLENGTHEDLNVTLFDVPGAEFNETELTENGTLVAMPHEETGTNTAYDFVRTNGAQDGPFVADGDVVVDSGAVTVDSEAATVEPEDNATEPNATEPNATTQASVVFENQTSDGTTVSVRNVSVPDAGYVAIHDSSLLDGNVVGSVIGVSEYQEAGTYENLTVTLYDVPGAEFNETELTENGTLVAMPHEETGTNTTYDFVATDGAEDGPFVADGDVVVDSGAVTVDSVAAPAGNGTAGNSTGGNGTAGNSTGGNGTAGDG